MEYNSEITVFVSTSKYLIQKNVISNTNMPICSCVFKIDRLSKNIVKKKAKAITRNMAKTVHINPGKRYLFIGENPKYADSALVEYIIESNQYGDEFIERWEKTKMLLFEYSVYDRKSKYIFTLSGIWDDIEKKWQFLRTGEIRTIVVGQYNDTPETIITKG